MPELKAEQAELSRDWMTKLAEMIAELQARGATAAGQNPHALALYRSSLTAGLAAHHLADPQLDLQPALAFARSHAISGQ